MNQVTKKKLKGIEHFKIKSIKINTKTKMKKKPTALKKCIGSKL